MGGGNSGTRGPIDLLLCLLFSCFYNNKEHAECFCFVFLISFISELVYLYLDLFPCNIPIVIYSYVPYELAGNLLHTLLPQTTM